ncbi:collagen alpha-1(XIII) chain-like [Bombina bombina]|uniref:collagen alpha-1(XIII) chain-like n=1 Tax=Bombina bombina TaxID=8345 RepID=UPI00235A77B0|nr:collagen alpha-1(XIII) chain-like [Bombina bombina]
MEGKSCNAASKDTHARSVKFPHRTEECGRCSRSSALMGCGFAGVSAFSLVLSLLLHFRTSDLQSRVLDLERQRYAQLSASVSADQMETSILGRVDQLLEEKLKSHLPRLREARDTSPKCLCPPGPPGARGRRGKNGDSGTVSLSLEHLVVKCYYRLHF